MINFMKKLLLFWLLFFSIDSFSQDPHFSQYQNVPLLINPALSGLQQRSQAIINHRRQWASIGPAFRTITASYDQPLTNPKKEKGFLSCGITVLSDQAGDHDLNQLYGLISIAYHVPVGEYSRIGAALNGGVGQKSISPDGFQWGSQWNGTSFDPSLPGGTAPVTNRFTFGDIGAGIVWNYNKGERYMTGNDHRSYTLGAAVYHANKPKSSFYNSDDRLPMRIVMHAEATVGIPNTNISFLPGFLFQQQGASSEWLAGARIRYLLQAKSNYTGFMAGKALSLGLHYRSQDAMIASLQVELGNYMFGYSYDINTSGLSNATNRRGGSEIFFRFLLPAKPSIASKR
mgnify:CR=1 FL=1